MKRQMRSFISWQQYSRNDVGDGDKILNSVKKNTFDYRKQSEGKVIGGEKSYTKQERGDEDFKKMKSKYTKRAVRRNENRTQREEELHYL